MSVAQLQAELSKLSAEEKLVLADYLVRQAEESSALAAGQLAELERRYADALARPDKLIASETMEFGTIADPVALIHRLEQR